MKKIALIILCLFTAYLAFNSITMYMDCMVSLKYEEAREGEIMYVINYIAQVFIYIVLVVFYLVFDKYGKIK